MNVPKCPRCNTSKHARPNGDRLWFCSSCSMLFDDSGDDGDVTYGDPARIAVRNENHQLADKARRKRGAGSAAHARP
jgi:ribosomal protein L37AE/L43A